MRLIFRKIFFYSNLLAVMALLFAYLSVYISPDNTSFFAFFGLLYPVLLVVNIGFVIFWAVMHKRIFLISLICILIGWAHLSQTLKFTIGRKGNPELKVLTYNVRLFNLYKWNKSEDIKQRIFNFVKNEAPDIICFQEFYSKKKKGEISTIATFVTMQNAKNYHIAYPYTSDVKKYSGMAIFTSFPIINRGEIRFENAASICIFSDIIAKSDTFRIYNAHLASNRFGYDTYKFIDSLTNGTNEQFSGVFPIMKKLSRGYIKRSEQADVLAAHIRNSPYPVIVCGDYNDTPVSYTYHKIRGELDDAFEEAGNGFGITYAGSFPPIRIDHILHSRELRAIKHSISDIKLSDHYPVSCTFSIR